MVHKRKARSMADRHIAGGRAFGGSGVVCLPSIQEALGFISSVRFVRLVERAYSPSIPSGGEGWGRILVGCTGSLEEWRGERMSMNWGLGLSSSVRSGGKLSIIH